MEGFTSSSRGKVQDGEKSMWQFTREEGADRDAPTSKIGLHPFPARTSFLRLCVTFSMETWKTPRFHEDLYSVCKLRMLSTDPLSSALYFICLWIYCSILFQNIQTATVYFQDFTLLCFAKPCLTWNGPLGVQGCSALSLSFSVKSCCFKTGAWFWCLTSLYVLLCLSAKQTL